MVSSGAAGRVRKHPEERSAEILDEAARLALAEGLERITLRAVAAGLGVRPGLISHYFPAAEDLVVAAFARAADGERAAILGSTGSGDPLGRMARFIARIERGYGDELACLWLNARHLARFLPGLADALERQEARDRDRMVALIEAGNAAGDFHAPDPLAACVRIFMAADGYGVYVNNPEPFDVDAYTHFVADVAEWALGVAPGVLRSRAVDMPEVDVVS